MSLYDLLNSLLIADISRALLLAVFAFVCTLITGKYWIGFLKSKNIGKKIRIDGPETHQVKTGTPTMGGFMIILPVAILTILFNLVNRWSILIPLSTLLFFGVIGAIDDSMSLSGSKDTRHGLSARSKLVLTILFALFVSLALYLPPPFGIDNLSKLRIPFGGELQVGPWIILFSTLVIVGSSHAVNLTDGVDSLAAWNLTISFVAYGVITLINGSFTNLMVFCFTLAGACMAFLWYNAHPAQIFMGDLGSLSLGAVLAVIALQSQQWITLPLVGVVFVVESASVIIQVSYFKWTRKRYGQGKRFFKMSPLHNHFELFGWSEPQITQRFMIVALIAALVGISFAINMHDSYLLNSK